MLNFIIALIIAFIVSLSIDSAICSVKFNDWYNKQCVKSAEKLPERQLNQLKEWVNTCVDVSTSEEVSYKDIKAYIPAKLKHKLNERKIRGIMYLCGYTVLSNCFLDSSCYAIHINATKTEGEK